MVSRIEHDWLGDRAAWQRIPVLRVLGDAPSGIHRLCFLSATVVCSWCDRSFNQLHPSSYYPRRHEDLVLEKNFQTHFQYPFAREGF